MPHARLRRLPTHAVGPEATVVEAATFRARLLGLALMGASELPSGHALVLRPCSSIHTFGMRFAIDVAFADAAGEVLRVIRDVPPRRVRRCPRARIAVETHAGELSRFLDGGRGAGAQLAPAVLG